MGWSDGISKSGESGFGTVNKWIDDPNQKWIDESTKVRHELGGDKAGNKMQKGDIKGAVLESRAGSNGKILNGINNIAGMSGSGGGGAGDRPAIVSPADVGAPGMSGFRGEGMADPRTAIIDQAAQAQFRTQQQNLIGQLALQASGRGPSVAGAQLQHASQANQAATFAQLASARGAAAGNPGLARNAMNTSANIQAQTSRDAAVARMQEQMNAQGQLGNAIGNARQQDIGMATAQAANQQQSNLAGYQGQLQMAQQYNDLKAKYAAMGLDAQKANQMAALDVQRLQQTVSLQDLDRANQQKAAAQAQQAGYITAAGQLVSTLYGGGGK